MSSDIIYRQLGNNGPMGEHPSWNSGTGSASLMLYPPVTALGFGAMGLSAFYGNQVSDQESHEVIRAAVDEGCTLIDTANVRSSLLNTRAPQ
jgi:hypothetical protein